MNKTELIESVLKPFLSRVEKGGLETVTFPRVYDNEIRIKVGLGHGRLAHVPFVAFLGEGQESKGGIYPVVAYFRNHNKVFVAYGVSVQEQARCMWGDIVSGKQTVLDYFKSCGIRLNPKTELRYAHECYDGVYEVMNGTVDEADLNRMAECVEQMVRLYKTIV